MLNLENIKEQIRELTIRNKTLGTDRNYGLYIRISYVGNKSYYCL